MKRSTFVAFFSLVMIIAGIFAIAYGGDRLGKFVNSLVSGSFWVPINDPLEGVASCKFKPITYSVGDIDADFGLPPDELVRALKEAEAIWEVGSGKELFEFDSRGDGSIFVNLVFDDRQKETLDLKNLLNSITTDEGRFDAVKAEYERELVIFKPIETEYVSLKLRYDPLRSDLDATVILYEKKREEYETEVAFWNKKGGAPKPVYDELVKDKADLDTLYGQIKRKESELKDMEVRIAALVDSYNASSGRLNTLGGILNRMSDSLNSNIGEYNQFQGERDEFVTGIYRTNGISKEIDVYQFYDHHEMVLILAHELGHALRAEHGSEPKSVMYPKIGAQGSMITEEDLLLLYKACPK